VTGTKVGRVSIAHRLIAYMQGREHVSALEVAQALGEERTAVAKAFRRLRACGVVVISKTGKHGGSGNPKAPVLFFTLTGKAYETRRAPPREPKPAKPKATSKARAPTAAQKEGKSKIAASTPRAQLVYGDVIVPPTVKVTLCPSGRDFRFTCRPEEVTGVITADWRARRLLEHM